jgi:holliday junction DNA helicase RuvA
MIHSLRGIVSLKEAQYAVLEVGGVGLKVYAPNRTLRALPTGEIASLFSHLHVREDALDLYGFLLQEELKFFELLIGVSGVGPRSALAVLDVAELEELGAAIEGQRPDLLTKASGIGRKTAERIILDLKGKVTAAESATVVRRMEGDSDLAETLMSLGYRREQAKAAVGNVDPSIKDLESRLKAALKILGRS